MPSSLKEIEKVMTSLWMNSETRDAFLENNDLKGAPTELAQEIDREGVALYANLLNFGHQEVIESIFPYCAITIGKKWEDVVDDYLRIFPPNHFNLNQTAKRFPEYLAKHADEYLKRYLFIVELADYEWLELELLEKPVHIAPQAWKAPTSPAEFIQLKPILNPTITVRHYSYPILHIASQIESHSKPPKKVKPEASCVAVYRDPVTTKCKFLALGNSAAKIIESCLASDKSYSELLKLAITENPNTNPEKTATEFLELLEQYQKLNVFVGSSDT